MREMSEEIGIAPQIKLAYVDLYSGHNLLKFLHTFTVKHNGPFTPNPSEVQKVEFFTLKEIRQMMQRGELFHPELVFLLEKHYFNLP